MSFPMPEQDPCYFCSIIEGKAEPWNIIARDEFTATLLNGRQFEEGQCVVIPLRHAPTLLDLDAAEAAAVMSAAQRLAKVMVEVFTPDGVLLYQNNGLGSGQEVPHFHLHVVPRRNGSDWGLGPPHIARLKRNKQLQKFDHNAVTQEKRQTVEALRAAYTHIPSPRQITP